MSLIEVNDVSKSYKNYGSELKRVINFFLPIFRTRTEIEVLKDISFRVHAGEAVGLVGVNGAGKSTLLKMITGTLQPSKGNIKRSGRISAILELGMGFNPNLTGRQNAIHAAGLMGYKFEEITKKLPEIEEFSEVGDYFDKPIRVYSSGMQVRVAFAVATAFHPDILIVDEALAVGDVYFQHKSFKRIKELQSQGTSLIIVSHDKSAILSLCTRVILLNKGRILKDGDPEEIYDLYNALLSGVDTNSVVQNKLGAGKVKTISGSGEVKIINACLRDMSGEVVEIIDVGQKVSLDLKVHAFQDVDKLVLGFLIKDRIGLDIFGMNTEQSNCSLINLRAGEIIEISVEMEMRLGQGSYSITVAVTDSETHVENNYQWQDNAVIFEVSNMSKTKFVGCTWLEAGFNVSRQGE